MPRSVLPSVIDGVIHRPTPRAARMAGTKTGLFSGPVNTLSAKDIEDISPHHHNHTTQARQSQRQCRDTSCLSHPRTFSKIITVSMRAADGSVTLRKGWIMVTNAKNRAGRGRSRRALCRISRGIRVHRDSFHLLQYESTENGQLLGKYCVCVSRLQLCYQDNFHDRAPSRPHIPPKGARE